MLWCMDYRHRGYSTLFTDSGEWYNDLKTVGRKSTQIYLPSPAVVRFVVRYIFGDASSIKSYLRYTAHALEAQPLMDVDRRGCRFPALGSALQQCQQSARGTLVVPLAATTRRAFPVAPTAPGPRQRPRPRERGRAGRGNSRATSIHSSPPGLSRYFRRLSRIATSWARSEGRMLSPRAGLRVTLGYGRGWVWGYC